MTEFEIIFRAGYNGKDGYYVTSGNIKIIAPSIESAIERMRKSIIAYDLVIVSARELG